MKNNILKLKGINKSFGGVKALINVDLEVKPGEIHAIVGENGAGKSTMMKIISGALHQDAGDIYLNGRKVDISDPKTAMDYGISIVYQEPEFYPHLTVTENFFTGKELISPGGSIRWSKMEKEAATTLEKFGLPPSFNKKRMAELTIGNQQLVLIARAVYHDARILILDEPTSILSQAETDILFKIMRKMKDEGKSILYISHRIEEIFQVCDNITILRDGQIVGKMSVSEATEDKIISRMSGRVIDSNYYQDYKEDKHKGELILSLNKLTKEGLFHDIYLESYAGEILGLYGLVGSGRSEIARTIFGDIKADDGQIVYRGKKVDFNSPREAIDAGIAYVPEDRGTQGTFAIRSVLDNIAAAIMAWQAKFNVFIDKEKENDTANKYVEQLSIKTNSLNDFVKSLSGGNQQKVVLARWLATNPSLLILDEPTRGIDVATKSEIHKLIIELAHRGIAIICISSELPEIMKIADKVMVLHEGKITASISRSEATEEKILRAAIGI